MSDARTKIREHYNAIGLLDRVNVMLGTIAPENQQLTISQLAPVDHFHVRGILATTDTVCLYGLGAIALPLAKRLRAFDVNLIGISRPVTTEKIAQFHVSRCFSVDERDKAFAVTDVLVLCMRYTEEMRGMLGARELAALRPGAYVINVARGGVVHREALYTHLRSGHLAGAGLDVFWQEPLLTDDPILTLPNVIATPHVGGVTGSSFGMIAEVVAKNIERLRRGESPLHRADQPTAAWGIRVAPVQSTYGK